MSTGPPASCRSRYRTGRTGRMKASWVPAHLQCSSDEGESRTRMPQGHDVLSVACLPFHHFADKSSPYGNRTRITRMRVSYPEPLEERAVLSVRRAGVEPAQPAACGLQPRGLANAQPTHIESDAGGSRTRRHQGLSLAAMPIRVPRHFSTPDRI